MKNLTTKKLFTLHSWFGVITGILMFVICFTGAVSVFGQDELRKWANPALRGEQVVSPEVIERLTADASSRVPEAYLHEVQINMPGRFYSDLVIVLESELKDEQGKGPLAYMLRYNLKAEALTSTQHGVINELYINSRESNAADFIVRFHADLHLDKLGLILTGTLGLALLASVITGVFIHRKILAQLFTFRPHKSFSLMLNDGHKQLGVWGVLFHATIGFTGAFLGLATVILLPAAAYVSFGGDQEKLVDTFLLIKPPVLSGTHQPTPIANILTDAVINGEQTVTFVNVAGYGDANAKAYVTVTGTQEMARNQIRIYDKGEFVEQVGGFSRLDGVSGVVLELLFPLHFGNFGGVLIKTIWTLLGLTTALLPLSGLMLWVERGVNSANPRFSHKTYDRFNRVLLGSCGGIVLACIAVFHGQLALFAIQPDVNVSSVMMAIFYTTWGLGIGWALIFPRVKYAIQWMLKLTAVLLMLVMPLNAIITGSHIGSVMDNQHFTTVIADGVFLLLGILLWRAVDKLRITELPARDSLNKPSSVNDAHQGA